MLKNTEISLFLTEKCNLNCDYCYQRNDKKKRIGSITYTKAINALEPILRDVKNNSKSVVLSFFGGEPLLEYKIMKKIVEYVELTYGDNVRFLLTTNGILLNSDIVPFLLKYNFRVIISIDGEKECQETHRFNRGSKGSESDYSKLLGNIDLLLSNGIDTGASMVVTDKTLSNLYENYKYLTKLGFSNININQEEFGDIDEGLFREQLGKIREFMVKDANKILYHLSVFDDIISSMFNLGLVSEVSSERAKDEMIKCNVLSSNKKCFCEHIGIDVNGKYMICQNIPYFSKYNTYLTSRSGDYNSFIVAKNKLFGELFSKYVILKKESIVNEIEGKYSILCDDLCPFNVFFLHKLSKKDEIVKLIKKYNSNKCLVINESLKYFNVLFDKKNKLFFNYWSITKK